MQIEIDFQVFKALTSLRESESDSYNAVIRRMLKLSDQNALAASANSMPDQSNDATNALATVDTKGSKRGLFGSGPQGNALAPTGQVGGLLKNYLGGTWFGDVHFPEGTKFRATYKGQTYYAEIKGGQWIGADGRSRRSPSDAASAISNTNVNGWRFWFVQLPGDPAWRKLDELKQ